MKFGRHKIDQKILQSKSRLCLLLYFREVHNDRYIKKKLLKGVDIQKDLDMSKRTYDGELSWLKKYGYLVLESFPAKGIKIKEVKLTNSL